MNQARQSDQASWRSQLNQVSQPGWQSPEALGRLPLRRIQRMPNLATFTSSRPPIYSSPSPPSRDRDDILFVIQNGEDLGKE
jgi:hypothetical protein